MGYRHGPNFSVVAIKFLDLVEFVAVIVLDDSIFGCRKEVVAVSLNAVLMGEEGFVAIAEIEAPYSNVFVGATCDN